MTLPIQQHRPLISLLFCCYWVGIVIVVCSRSSIAIRPSDAFLHPTTPSSPFMIQQRRRRQASSSSVSTLWFSKVRSMRTPTTTTTNPMSNLLHVRGGGNNEDIDVVDRDSSLPRNDITELLLSETEGEEASSSSSTTLLQPESSPNFSTASTTTASVAMLFPITIVMNVLRQCSHQYTLSLQQYPIRTKSVTAGIIFAMSDGLAQLLTKSSPTSGDNNDTATTTIVWTRILSSAAVGFFYFGPAAHYWYSWIFRILPSTSLFSTLQKAVLGQLFFGPSFTCIFFAMSLIQSRTFTLKNWMQKIRNDLPSAWIAGAGYWPIVDLISYSYVPPQYIPLFVNICSFFWTTYLVVKSYK